jgi:hypothetical protein
VATLTANPLLSNRAFAAGQVSIAPQKPLIVVGRWHLQFTFVASFFSGHSVLLLAAPEPRMQIRVGHHLGAKMTV